MVPKPEYIPAKEVQFSDSKAIFFGACCECKYPITYPPIKIPRSCTEIENWEEAGAKRYSVDYADYHICCAVKYFLLRSAVDLRPKIHLPERKGFKFINKLFEKIYGKIEVSIDLDSYQTHNQKGNK